MVSVLRYFLIFALLTVLAFGQVTRPRFYPDDPIWSVPPPTPVAEVKKRDIDALYDFMWQSFRPQGKPPVPSRGINTLGEVPDSEWFTNRHAKKRMSPDELQRGPGNQNSPVAPFRVVGAKTEGITPGFNIRDAQNRLYFVKIDPRSNPEMSTAADVIGSKFFYALGYYTPENYILNAHREQLAVSDDAKVEVGGKERQMNSKDLDLILDHVPRRKDGSYRLLASLAVKGAPIGPFRYEGTRRDDPNDVVPHDLRRDLRGLYVFCAWLNHTDSKAGNTLDAVVEENGIKFVRHYLIDFGAILGSDSDMPKNARFGHEYIFPDRSEALKAIASLGLYTRDWERADSPSHLKAVGRFEAKAFNPTTWRSNYPNPAFLSRQPEDEYWAAKQVVAFTNEDIRAIVETGQFSDPRVVDYLVATLAERRDKIGRAFLSDVLPLDNFRISGNEIVFDDLALKYGFSAQRQYRFRWFLFDNRSGAQTSVPGARPQLPSNLTTSGADVYLATEIRPASGSDKSVTVYLRKAGETWSAVGIDRQ